MDKPTYKLTLHKTYYDKGFFNLGVSVDRFVRKDSGPAKLVLAGSSRTLTVTVNRDANQNGTPRVMGGAELRNWIQRNFEQGDTIDIVIESPTHYRVSRR